MPAAAVAASTAAAMATTAAMTPRYGGCSAPAPVAAATPSTAAARAAARRSHAVSMVPAAIVVSIRFVDPAHVTLIDVSAAIVSDTNTPGHRNQQQTADRTDDP
jgi:hypothetical protein